MAKINPFQFINETRAEVSKVVWPSRREIILTTVMVFIMATLAALFFFFTDQVIQFFLETILRVAS